MRLEAAVRGAPAPAWPGRLAHWCARQRSWRRLLLATLLGALAAAALPPLYLVPALVPAFVGLLWLLDGADRARSAFLLGWGFGLGYFAAGLYWIGVAFLVDADAHGALILPAVAGLASGLALFTGFTLLLVRLSGARGWCRVLVLAAAWLLAEWLRAWVLTGFPWNLIGSVWAGSEAMIQGAALFGVWGLSAATLVIAGLPAVAGVDGSTGLLRRWGGPLAALALLCLMWGGGQLRLAGAVLPAAETVPGVVLRIVQPAIAQQLKWDADLRRQHLDTLLALTGQPAAAGRVTHVVWPETAVPYDLSGSPELGRYLGSGLPAGALLLTGAPRRHDGAGGTLEVWNSLHALGGDGRILATYDKFHLVPFGEYVPLRELLDFTKLTHGRVDFSAGPGPATLEVPGLPRFSPLICYEIIFPARVVAAGPRPGLLLAITNDAWFGDSSGPYQHLAAARLRAVEEGLPVIRAANTGISAAIDGYGRILANLALDRPGIIDTALPRPVDGRTIFSKIGNWSVLFLIIALIAPWIIIRVLKLSLFSAA